MDESVQRMLAEARAQEKRRLVFASVLAMIGWFGYISLTALGLWLLLGKSISQPVALVLAFMLNASAQMIKTGNKK